MHKEKPKALQIAIKFVPTVILFVLAILFWRSGQYKHDYHEHFYEHFDAYFDVDVVNIDASSHKNNVIISCACGNKIYDFEMSSKKYSELSYVLKRADIILKDDKPYKIIPRNSNIYYDPLMPIESDYFFGYFFDCGVSYTLLIYAVYLLIKALIWVGLICKGDQEKQEKQEKQEDQENQVETENAE